MAKQKPVLARTRNGFRVIFGPYTTKVFFRKNGLNSEPLNVETFLGRKKVAFLNGTTIDDAADIYNVDFLETVSKVEGLRALSVLVPCTEIALRQAGIKSFKGRTHKGFARFLGRMGWRTVEEGKTHFDVEKDISKQKPEFLFRARSVTPKSKKRTTARKIRRL